MLGQPTPTEATLRGIIGDYGASTSFPTANTAGKDEGRIATTPADLTYGNVVSGNWSEAIVARWGGLEMAEDGGVGKGFPTDESYIKMRMYLDVATRSPESFVAVTDAKMR
jgi:hypothetical protein